MKTHKDPSEESLRQALSQKFSTFEKEPDVQLTDSIFEAVKRLRRDRIVQGTIITVLIFSILLTGGLLYFKKEADSQQAMLHTGKAQQASRYVAKDTAKNRSLQPANAGYGSDQFENLIAKNNVLSQPVSKAMKSRKENTFKSIVPKKNHSPISEKAVDPGATESRKLNGVFNTETSLVAISSDNQEFLNERSNDDVKETFPPLGLLESKPFLPIGQILKTAEPAVNSDLKPAYLSKNADKGWKFIIHVTPTNTFQILNIIPQPNVIFKDFSFPERISFRRMGYKLNAGAEKAGLQFLISYSQFTQSVRYHVAGDEFILVPDALNAHNPVRKSVEVNDKNVVKLIGFGLKKRMTFVHGPLRTHFVEAGSEFSKQIKSKQNALWLNASVGKNIAISDQATLSIGPYLEYSLLKFKSENRVYMYNPYQIGLSVGMRLGK